MDVDQKWNSSEGITRQTFPILFLPGIHVRWMTRENLDIQRPPDPDLGFKEIKKGIQNTSLL
jgi:hypothetical protein